MSMYSGKCDLYDTIEVFGEDYILKSKIYIGSNDKPLNFNNIRDLIPYYPHIICTSSGDKTSSIIHLTTESFVDIEEREFLEFHLKEILRIYNRCKRKKIEFKVEDVLKELSIITNQDITRELIERVKKNGKKANIDGLHLSSSDYYRKELVEEMKKNGLNPADYGYERFC